MRQDMSSLSKAAIRLLGHRLRDLVVEPKGIRFCWLSRLAPQHQSRCIADSGAHREACLLAPRLAEEHSCDASLQLQPASRNSTFDFMLRRGCLANWRAIAAVLRWNSRKAWATQALLRIGACARSCSEKRQSRLGARMPSLLGTTPQSCPARWPVKIARSSSASLSWSRTSLTSSLLNPAKNSLTHCSSCACT